MKALTTKDLTHIALVTAFICVVAPLTLVTPFSPVPLSLASLVIYACSIIIGSKKSVIATIIYIVIGAIGVPVFSNFVGGFSKIIGPTGGYLVGYIFIALFTSFFAEKHKESNFMYILGMLLGTLICYALGTFWLCLTSSNVSSFKAALLIGVFPFVLGDIVKMTLGLFVGKKIKKRIKLN